MTAPLPIVPPAAANESLGSWLQRTASIYDLSAHQLLDRWDVATGAKTVTRPSVEWRVVAGRALPLLADRLRASPQAVSAMMAPATQWLVACNADTAACPQCLAGDDAAGLPRFRRRGWAQCWQVRCVKHRIPLVDMQDWRSKKIEAVLAAVRVEAPHRRNATGRLVVLGRCGEQGESVRAAMNAIAQLEAAVCGALAGRRPHAASWGDIDPEDFLGVVRDVTTFVLSRFDPHDQRVLLCLRDLHRYGASPSMPCFERQRQGPGHGRTGGVGDLVDLATVGDVGWRRCALYWARELMHARTQRSWLPLTLRRDRHERQRVSLAYQSEAAVDWLKDRARRWPENYRRQRWKSLSID